MNTITIQVEDNRVWASLKGVLSAMKGVTVIAKHKKANALDEALDDVRCGRLTEYESAEDMYQKLGL